MQTVVVLVASVLALASAQLPTVPELDVAKYSGTWYNVWGNRYGWIIYGDDAVCMTATYGPRDESSVTVVNFNRVGSVTGPTSVITGFATLTDEVGKLIVQLEGVPFPADYWVVKLGDADFGADNLYSYAVVTNADSTSLFVLARDVNMFKEMYETEVLVWLADNGFTGYFTRPVPIYHDDNCVYGF